MNRSFTLNFAAALSIAGAAWFPIHAAPTGFLSDYLKARPVIAAAVEAEGGAAAIAGVHQLQYEYGGSIYNVLQGLDPEKVTPEPFSISLAFDFDENLQYQLPVQTIPGVIAIPSPTFYKDGKLYSLNNFQKQYNVTAGDPGPAFDAPSRYMPLLVFKRLMKNIKSAAWRGERVVDGRHADVIEFSWDQTTRCQLDIDREHHDLLQLRFLSPDSLVGDDEAAIAYTGRQTIGGLQFPKRAIAYRRGERFLDLALHDVKVNERLDPMLFVVPTEFVESPSPKVVTERLGTNLYEVSGISGGTYRSQFIDAGPYVVVFEAPLNFAVSQQVISEIRKTLGEKPIKYVVLSHFHNDHAAGVGAYVAIGATVVTTKANENIVTRYARSGSVLSGAGLHPDLQPAFLDVIGDMREIVSDGGRKVVVYRVPDVPHVNEMLTLYDPSTRTIIDGDLFAEFFPFSPAYQRFAEWLQSPDAPEVLTIAGVHHPPMAKKTFLELASGNGAKGTP